MTSKLSEFSKLVIDPSLEDAAEEFKDYFLDRNNQTGTQTADTISDPENITGFINLKSQGLVDGSDIRPFLDIIASQPNKKFVIPGGTYTLSGAGTMMLQRGFYDIETDGKVVINCADGADGSEILRVAAPLVGTSWTIYNRQNTDEYATRLTENAPIGSRVLSLASIPEDAQVGDVLQISTTRSFEGENRSFGYESHVSEITAIDRTANTVTLREPVIFDNLVGFELTGTVTGNATQVSSYGSGLTYVPVEFDQDISTISDRNFCGLYNSTTRPVTGTAKYVDRFNRKTNELVFSWYQINPIPQSGDVFTINIDSFVTIRPRVHFKMAGEWQFNYDVTSENNPSDAVSFMGLYEPEISGIGTFGFGSSALIFEGCYRGDITKLSLLGNGKKPNGRFDSHAINIANCWETVVHDFEMNSYGQAINFGGYQGVAVRCKVFDWVYTGGGANSDGTLIEPYPPGYDGDTTYSTNAASSHGGSHFSEIYRGKIINTGTPLGGFRGKMEKVHDIDIYGAAASPISLFNNAGFDCYNINYYTDFSRLKDTGLVPSTVDGVEYDANRYTPNIFFSWDHTYSDPNYPVILKNIYSDVVGHQVVRFSGSNGDSRAPGYNNVNLFIWGDLVVRSARPTNSDSYFKFIGGYPGRSYFLNNCQDLGGNAVLDVINRDLYMTWEYRNERSLKVPDYGYEMSPDGRTILATLPDDGIMQIPLKTQMYNFTVDIVEAFRGYCITTGTYLSSYSFSASELGSVNKRVALLDEIPTETTTPPTNALGLFAARDSGNNPILYLQNTVNIDNRLYLRITIG